MKKIFTIAICAVITLSLAACGKDESVKQTQSNNEVQSSMPTGVLGGNSSATASDNEGGKVEISNSWVVYETMDEAENVAGFDVSVPETVGEYTARIISVNTSFEPTTIEVYYSNSDDSVNGVRIRKAPGSQDISGDFNVYEKTYDVKIEERDVTMKGNGDVVSLAIWTENNYTYSLYVSTGISNETMIEIVSNIF